LVSSDSRIRVWASFLLEADWLSDAIEQMVKIREMKKCSSQNPHISFLEFSMGDESND
jgi:hypothetical protein